MGKVFDDKLLIEEYAKCKTCREVALKFGCSNETVRRALIRNGVPRVEKKIAHGVIVNALMQFVIQRKET